MLSVDLGKKCAELARSLAPDGSATHALNVLEQCHESLMDAVAKMVGADDRNVINSLADHAWQIVGAVGQSTRGLSWLSAAAHVARWQSKVDQFNAWYDQNIPKGDDPSPALGLSASLQGFHGAMDRYLSEQTKENSVQLLIAAASLSEALRTTVGWLRAFAEVCDPPEVPEGLGGLELRLSGEGSVERMLKQLTAMRDLYSLVCRFVGVEQADHPLVLLKLETGSLWAKFAGEPKVIEVLDRYISVAAGFMYRRFTLEGKIQAVPTAARSLDSLLGLRATMEAQGMPTKELDEELTRGAAMLGRQLNDLLEQQGRVIVNGRSYGPNDRESQLLLERREPYLLMFDEPGQPDTPEPSRLEPPRD